MSRIKRAHIRTGHVLVLLAIAGALTGVSPKAPPAASTTATTSYIIQAADTETASRRVSEAGAAITGELGIIQAVVASLDRDQVAKLRSHTSLRLFSNEPVTLALPGKKGGRAASVPVAEFPRLVGANRLHLEGVLGQGVTVAVIDSGVDAGWWNLRRNSAGESTMLHSSTVIPGPPPDVHGNDLSGHGTHVASVIVNNATGNGKGSSEIPYNGVAPGVRLVSVRAFDANGHGTYGDVIAAIDRVLAYKDTYDIRVLNLSFSATPRSHYWDDPLNQAVMRAWQAGIVVVASAGNGGPEPMTIGVPGNVPYVITVGAMSDAATSNKTGDDFLTSFSAAGPTHEGFVKPEVVAPGGHIVAVMTQDDTIAAQHWDFHDQGNHFTMSGTSQSAAVVSGIAALMLQVDPTLTPADVKCRLMASARPAVNGDGTLAYSVFQQGAGMAHAYDAVYSDAAGCANRGTDIDLDLAGVQHYGGRANQLADGTYYLRDLPGDGYLWSGGFLWSDAFLWSEAFLWSDGVLWSDAFLWSDGDLWYGGDLGTGGFLWSDAFLWSEAFLWSDGFLWSDTLTESMSINNWVPQE